MKKILIVGCQGYLGSQICKLFIRDKYEVDGIDIGYFKNCEISNTTKINIKKKLAQNITKNDLIKYNVVIQLAAFSNDPLDKHKAKDFYKPTVKYTLKIAQMCKELNIKFIFPSSCSVYGYSMKKLTEKDKPNPLTFYSKNKVEIEKGLSKLKSKEFNPIILRLATVFGFSSRIRFDVVINMICGMSITKNKILLNSNGLAWRPHIHIDDVYEVFKYFVDLKKYTGDMTYNVGRNDNNCRVIDIANLIKKIL
ncbi:SDR family oxidoreductase, partial [Alphaproteobacteria bacterium]|nr:SDR family oxidoreductase [Alphaproteobacteria bacterium]